jgi:predicted SAM-dependent methyltransferase
MLTRTPVRWLGRWKAKRFQETGQPIRLDLGCGPFKRPGFVGLDLAAGSDIQWDIAWGLPFGDSTVLEVRSDHFFEHMDLPLVVRTLRECHRVLVTGGILDFSVPHIDPYLKAYMAHDFAFLKEKIFDVPKSQEDLYCTGFDRISWLLLRSGEHKSMFDAESIIAKVQLSGFSDVRFRAYDPSRDTQVRFSTCFVVAVK